MSTSSPWGKWIPQDFIKTKNEITLSLKTDIYKPIVRSRYFITQSYIKTFKNSCRLSVLYKDESMNFIKTQFTVRSQVKCDRNSSVSGRKCKMCLRFNSLTIPPCTRSLSSRRQGSPECMKHSLYSSLVHGSLPVCGNDPHIYRKIHNFHRWDTKCSFALVINSLRQKQHQRTNRALTRSKFLL